MRLARPVVLVLALALGLATVWLSVRTLGFEAEGARAGIYTPADGPRAADLIQRMAAALVAMQRQDGSFDPNEEVGVQTDQEQIAADALAVAALVRVRALGRAYGTPHLGDAVERGLAWLRSKQQDDGRLAPDGPGPESRFYQVDATAAGLLAFVLAGDPESIEAAKRAGPALAAFEDEGLRNGWSRALAAIAVDAVYDAHRQSVFPQEARARRVVRGRPAGERRDQHDMSVAEAIVRLFLRRSTSVADDFPEAVLAACLENPPRWQNRTSDMQLWWMQAWVVARGPGAAPWFHDLVAALDEEALGTDARVPGGYYATSLVQTSAAILALAAGLQSQAEAL